MPVDHCAASALAFELIEPSRQLANLPLQEIDRAARFRALFFAQDREHIADDIDPVFARVVVGGGEIT